MRIIQKFMQIIDVGMSIYFYIMIYFIAKNPVICNIITWGLITIMLWFIDFLYLKYFQRYLINASYEEISQLQITDLNYIGTYISYFIIGIGMPHDDCSDTLFWVVLSVLFIFLFRTKTVGFNIFHLLNGWHYYNVTNQDNYTMTTLLKRNDLRKVKQLKLLHLHNNIFIGTV